MTLSKKQEKALKIAASRYNSGEKYTIVTGYGLNLKEKEEVEPNGIK